MREASSGVPLQRSRSARPRSRSSSTRRPPSARALAGARAERAGYLAELEQQQALTDAAIARLTGQAAAAERKGAEESSGGATPTPVSAPAPAPTGPPAAGTRMTVSSTGYCLRGHTSTGIPTGWGVVAVDPAVIPLGTRMTIPGYGEGVAADTGSAVRGAIIDVWFPTCSQALDGAARSSRSPSTSRRGFTRFRARLQSSRPLRSDEGAHHVSRRGSASGEAARSLRVLLVDDHDLFRSGLRSLLEEQGLNVVGEADNGQSAMRLVSELAPDVVIMDLNMPGLTGVETTRQLAGIAPHTRVVVLTISADDEDVMDAVMAGACGYLLKDSSIDELIAGSAPPQRGESLISPQIAAKLLQRLRAQTRRRRGRGRSARSSPTASSRC